MIEGFYKLIAKTVLVMGFVATGVLLYAEQEATLINDIRSGDLDKAIKSLRSDQEEKKIDVNQLVPSNKNAKIQVSPLYVLLQHDYNDSLKNNQNFRAQQRELVTLLLEHGANPSLRIISSTSGVPLAGINPLQEATWQGLTDIVELFLNRDLNQHPIDIYDLGLHGGTLIHDAAESGRTEIVRLLLNAFPNYDLSLQDIHGNLPINYARNLYTRDLILEGLLIPPSERIGQRETSAFANYLGHMRGFATNIISTVVGGSR